jgi:hypothetical protein
MVAEEGEGPGDDLARPFSRETKCCTFTPRIPNYMAGGILSDMDPSQMEGRRRLKEKIRSGEGILPNGIYPSRAYNDHFSRRRTKDFGRSKELLCPYFVPGPYNCSIWKYREAICSFWYCKHLAAGCGARFWDSMIDYFKSVQEALAQIAAKSAGLSLVDPFPGKPANHDPVKIWGEWIGREEEYYIRCFEIVRDLTGAEAKEMLYRVPDPLKALEQNYEEFLYIPRYLRANRKLIQRNKEGFYQIEVNSYIQTTGSTVTWTFQMPAFAIDYFNGSTDTEDVVRLIQEGHSTTLEPEILIALYRHDILLEHNSPLKSDNAL